MLTGKIIDKVFNAGNSISTDRSRCLRMRFNQNSCARCSEQCRFNALSIAEDVRIEANQCSECMLCVSSCHSDCFEINGFDYYSLIGKLRKIQSSVGPPVLGCRANVKAISHEKTFCFGFLSEEHIIALAVLMNGPLQIDLSGCADCTNSFIIDALDKRIKNVEAKTSVGTVDQIRLIRNKTDLDFQEVSYGRRGFFKALADSTRKQAAGFFDDEDHGEVRQAYSAKTVPFKRELVNRALEILPGERRKALLKNYYYTVDAADTCNSCFACIGMCPTGALKIESKGDDRELFFNTSLCNGCGLCEDFCTNRSISVKNGFSGDNPFEFIRAKKVTRG
jgi:ferredoxin